MNEKSTVDEIRARFDADVERFSNLETGQVAAMDSPLHMALVAEAAAAVTPGATRVLDIGCGAGNYTLKLLERFDDVSAIDIDLIDLSRPMLDRAVQRISATNPKSVTPLRGDIRELDLGEARYDIVMAAQCLHHLRADAEWEDVFKRIYTALRPGGSFWIADQVTHDHPALVSVMKQRQSDYLVGVGGPEYRDKVFAYVQQEDTPRSLAYQTALLRRVGFGPVELLHKHCNFASFGGVKPPAAP